MTDRIGGVSGPFVYGRSWQWALFIAVMISWGAMNIIAFFFERRTLLNPSTQFKQFWFGDLFCLPGIVLLLRYASQHVSSGGHWWQNPAWHIACLVVGLIAGVMFHRHDSQVYPLSELNSPTKLYHDLVGFPVYVYVLLSAVPAFISALPRASSLATAGLSLGVVCLIAIFFWLGNYDQQPGHTPTGAHIPYDWKNMRPAPRWPNN